ncbi:MAG TPA: flagellar hook-basal body complex protein FliE [Acidobacteriaceae bacterium]|nr:flagellar hook-basal body complex protein FliE [Acidobacteriaceae bacterium]
MQTVAISNVMAKALNQADLTGDLAGGAETTGQTPFAGMLKDAIQGVQSLENQAANEVQGLITGQGVDIHEAMIATQKADMSFEMALAVRSKAVAAYQQLMQMQF